MSGRAGARVCGSRVEGVALGLRVEGEIVSEERRGEGECESGRVNGALCRSGQGSRVWVEGEARSLGLCSCRCRGLVFYD